MIDETHPQQLIVTPQRRPIAPVHPSVALPMAPTAPPGVFPPTLRPFQFPSLGHFDARANEVVARVANIEHLRTSTVEWMRRGYLSFRAFLMTTNAAEAFLSGDFYRQEETLTQWRAWLLTRGVGRVSVRTYWGAVKAICSRIEAQDGMASPLRWIAPPRVGRVLPKSLTRDAARTVLEFVQNYEWKSPFVARRNSAIVGSMLLAGLRCGEVLRLRSDDVDGQQGTFRIREGKGRDGGKDRTAYMSPQLKELISAYREARVRWKPAAPTFFATHCGDRPLGRGAIKGLFLTIRAKTGILVSPHRLRHTYATLLRQSGVPDRVSMDLLGHTQLTMLQRYSHVFEHEYPEEVRKLAL